MRLPTAIACWLALLAAAGPAQAEITARNLRCVQYPGFPGAHSTWGSIGYSAAFDRVYAGVTNHRDTVALYEYDCAAEDIRLLGFLPDMAHLRGWQWQGKIHSQIVEGPDSAMYFSSDGGETRMLYLMNHPAGYSGGYYYRWDIPAGRLDRLTMGMRYDSVKDMVVGGPGGKILGATFPRVHLLLYDPAVNELRDLGNVGSAHVPRVLFADRWGNMYYVDWRQRLIKYEQRTGRLIFAEHDLPMFPDTPGYTIITGPTAWARFRESDTIYLVTYGSKLVAYHPRRDGIGEWEDLGGIFDSEREPYGYYCPNLAAGDNGKLYYFIGGHGKYAVKGRTVLMEYDPATGERRQVLDFPLEEISEVTGANITDEAGNMYFLGRRRDFDAERMGESGASRPFLIVFNPERELE